MSAEGLLPWLATDWQKLSSRQLEDRLPHALMLTGKSGVGKSAFSLFAAQSFLCERPGSSGFCGSCNSCHLFAAGTHPDFLQVSPPEGKLLIGVDQVRELIAEMELTPQCSARKVAVLDPADAMNTSSANALLKTLEEPALTHLIMLVCTTPGYLPATIRSRCQRVSLAVRDADIAKHWLSVKVGGKQDNEALWKLAPDAPLRALALADGDELAFRVALFGDVLHVLSGRQSTVQVAGKYKDVDTRSVLSVLMSWFADAVKLHMGCDERMAQSVDPVWAKRLANALSLDEMFIIYKEIQHFYAIDSSSFKTQAVLEGLFADMRLNHLN